MIYAKINPVAEVYNSSGPFGHTTTTGSYAMVVADPYFLGANMVTFNVHYGEAIINEDSSFQFNRISSGLEVLSGSVIDTWGNDDSIILAAVLENQGTQVVEIFSGSFQTMRGR